jgi:hypothetical protein
MSLRTTAQRIGEHKDRLNSSQPLSMSVFARALRTSESHRAR